MSRVIQAQEWLDKYFSDKESTKEINLWKLRSITIGGHAKLAGKLIIKDYPNLEEIKINCEDYLTQLQVNNCKKLRRLVVSKCNLSDLVLFDLPKLQWLNCSYNTLSGLNLTGLRELTELKCNNNYLNKLDFLSSNINKLTWLNIKNNNFVEQNLLVFSQLTNLEYLLIGSDKQERIEQGIYNRFFGSFEPLRNLTKLRILELNNTDINLDLEYLSTSLKLISSRVNNQPKSQAKTTKTILEPYDYSYSVWRKKNQDWVDKILKDYNILHCELNLAHIVGSAIFRDSPCELNNKERVFQILCIYLKEKIRKFELKIFKKWHKQTELQTQIRVHSN